MKKLLLFALVAVLAVGLCSCGLKKADVVGAWQRDNGVGRIDIFEDGSCSYIAGSLASLKTGSWEIEGSKLYITYDGEKVSHVYQLKNDKLVSGTTSFSRQER